MSIVPVTNLGLDLEDELDFDQLQLTVNQKVDPVSQLNSEQFEAYQLIKSGKSIFVTGEAGCGKSFLIKTIRDTIKNVAVTAMTGAAALLVGGRTLHSWAGIGTGEGSIEKLIASAKRYKNSWVNWKTTKVLIIDEVSMMDLTLFEKIMLMSQYFRPDGTLQIVLFGDMMQLPPVKKNHFCFESSLWNKFIFKTVELTVNMRQNDDEFKKYLSEIRMGVVSKDTIAALRSREADPPSNIVPTRMYSTRRDTDAINLHHLEKLGNIIEVYEAQIDVLGDVPANMVSMFKKNDPFAQPVRLAVGAQVLMMRNDTEMGLVNGSKGVIKSIDENKGVTVCFYNGITTVIPEFGKSIEFDNGMITITRLPLMLGWAITMHKAQGMTLEHTQVDIGASVFAEGQTYTALSRVKSLDNLYVIDFDPMKVRCNPKAKKFYEQLRANDLNTTLVSQPPPSVVECWVCMDAMKRPVTLRCGHNLCKDCWDHIKAVGDERCGLCRSSHTGEVKVNNQLGEIIKLLC